MPNTEPVVDSAAVLGALHERARESAVVPVGFMAAISKGQSGEELTEMAELARAARPPLRTTGPSFRQGCCAARCSTAR
jgi:dihydroorotase